MAHHSAGAPVLTTAIRIVLLVLLTVLFVGAVVAIFSATTGSLEKLVLAGVALLLACAVPRVQRLGSNARRRPS